jgi:hypothetical protein
MCQPTEEQDGDGAGGGGSRTQTTREAAGLSNGLEKKIHFSCARTGSFLGGQSTTMQKRFGLND